jgi:5-formyltetrahydrofolate cyclo-ligase
MTANTTSVPQSKQDIREQAHAARRALENKDELSVRIMDRVLGLPEYTRAATVMFYIDVRAEVRTRQALPAALANGKAIVVPWCNEHGELELFRLESMDELELGMYRILEPKAELRNGREKQVAPEQLDLILVPGVAFDRRGGRTGHGKGYYDKLLQHARVDAPLVGLAFECQLFPEIPMQEHDIFMDKVVTEEAVYGGRGRA